jgi:hypothetical protein
MTVRPLIRPGSSEWAILRSHIRTRIGELRDELEVVGAEPNILRGQIMGLRWLISAVDIELPDDKPEEADYFPVRASTPS